MSVWVDKVKANVTRLMETDITATANSTFAETKATNSLQHNATSTFNGSWSVQMGGLSINHEINNTWLFDYTVVLKLGFTINPKQRFDPNTSTVVNDKLEYNEAVEDIELIATKALDASLYNSLLENIELVSVSPFEYINELENFGVCEMVFVCSGRTTV